MDTDEKDNAQLTLDSLGSWERRTPVRQDQVEKRPIREGLLVKTKMQTTHVCPTKGQSENSQLRAMVTCGNKASTCVLVKAPMSHDMAFAVPIATPSRAVDSISV